VDPLSLPTIQVLADIVQTGRELAHAQHHIHGGQAPRAHGLIHHTHPTHHSQPTHRFHRVRAGADYLGVFLAAVVSWVAIPGLGEAALIAAGISARHGHLDLTTVVASAFAGASLGGMVGWQIGRRGGRALLTAPGVMLRLRLSMIARGERFYERYGPIAVLFTPSWAAGIHRMPWPRFLILNTLSALVWAAAIGVGADLIGPSITDVVADAGTAGEIALGVLVLVAAALLLWRRGRGAGKDPGAPGPDRLP
jgi:membrane protein DedA with SNARE-associated domain